jgi:hypothetical protein
MGVSVYTRQQRGSGLRGDTGLAVNAEEQPEQAA